MPHSTHGLAQMADALDGWKAVPERKKFLKEKKSSPGYWEELFLGCLNFQLFIALNSILIACGTFA